MVMVRIKKLKRYVIKSTKLKRVAHLKNMKKPFQNNIFIPTHLREAEETMFPLSAHCVQLFQKEMFTPGPSTRCEVMQTHSGVTPISKAAFRKRVVFIMGHLHFPLAG